MQWTKTVCSRLHFLLTNVSIRPPPHKQQVINQAPQNSIWHHGAANVSGDMPASDTTETQLSSWETSDWRRGRGDDFTKLKDCILLFNLRLYTWLHCGKVTRQRSSANWSEGRNCVWVSALLLQTIHINGTAMYPGRRASPALTQPGTGILGIGGNKQKLPQRKKGTGK